MSEFDYVKMHTESYGFKQRFEIAKLEVQAQQQYKEEKSTFRFWPIMVSKVKILNIRGSLVKATQARLLSLSSN